MSPSAKELLSKHPELCKEIIDANMIHSIQFHAKHTTRHDNTEIAWFYPEDVWAGFVQKNTKPERDWEILSFKNIATGEIEPPIYLPTDSLVKQTSAIHSVKRLSDNEVFTIGDKTNFGVIEKMIESWIGLEVQFNNMTAQRLSVVAKSLFTTEDGKQIFEGDTIFWIACDIGGWGIHEQIAVASQIEVHRKTLKYFSTREAAEEYVLMNKPCLSINDIQQRVASKTPAYSFGGIKEQWIVIPDALKEFAKSKQ